MTCESERLSANLITTLYLEMSTNYYVSAGGYVSDLFPRHLFITLQGKQLQSHNYLNSGSIVTIFVRSLGGKGGYGQLLKDFGKETALSRNKKSCRDLSGKPLINDRFLSTYIL